MPDTLDGVLARYPDAQTFRMGDNAVLCAELIALVRSGKKRATCSSIMETQAGQTPPEIGRCDVALEWGGAPAFVIQTQELRHVRFCDMTEEMALMEGENETLEGWIADHRRYFERNGVFETEMPLIWERFTLVEDLAEA